jgi:hypothetical protein
MPARKRPFASGARQRLSSHNSTQRHLAWAGFFISFNVLHRVHLLLGRGACVPHRRSKGAPTHVLVVRFAGITSDNRIVNM